MTLGSALVVLGFVCSCVSPALTFVTDWGDLEYDDFTEDANDLEYGQDIVTGELLNHTVLLESMLCLTAIHISITILNDRFDLLNFYQNILLP